MKAFNLPFSYLLWHYTVAWGDLLRLYRNFSWFLWNFFSIRILSSTLFSPWHRMREGKSKDTGGFLGSLILNLLLRLIGFFARFVTILFGFASLVLLSFFFLAFLAVWLCMPAIVIGLIASGASGVIGFF